MKILLLPPYFYPDEPIGAARWNRLSKYLLKNEHEIFVIASSILSNSNTSKLCNKLIRVDYQSSLVDQLLLWAGNSKKEFKVEKERQSLKTKEKFSLLSIYSVIITTLGKFARFPSVYWWSDAEIVSAGKAVVKAEKIDIIVGSHPFAVSLKAACKISKITGVPWIADMRDGWSSYYFGEYQQGTFYYKMLKKIEGSYLRKASKVVTVNEKLANTLMVTRENVIVIPNVYDPEAVLSYVNTSQDDSTINFAFAGSVHENHCWDILFEGVSNVLRGVDPNQIVINYYGGYYELLNAKRKSFDIPEGIIINHGYIEKKKLIDEFAKADLLLVFGFHGSFGDTVTTGKIFDYIETGKPVIAIGPPTSELAALVEATGIGSVISDSESVVGMLRSLLKDKNKYLEQLNQCIRKNELLKYSADELADKYLQVFKDVLRPQGKKQG